MAPARVSLAAPLLLAAACGGGGAPAPPDHPNVVLFVIDTLRADRVSAYGCPENTTPNLDAFAREGLLFERAYAPAPQTAPSHASLFTSTHPASHGIWNEVPVPGGPNAHPKLPESAVTLAEVFRDAGYTTAAIADGGWIQRSRGFDQGFDHFHSRYLGAEDRVSSALDWLEETGREQPFFLFLHTYQVHTPYLPPAGYEERFARGYQGPLRQALAEARAYAASGASENPLVEVHDRCFKPLLPTLAPADLDFLRALYDAELSYVDEQFARLLAYLRLHGLLEHTILVVTSDHGEEFGEHGDFSHNQVYDECLHVPLIVRTPGGPRGARRADPLDLLDLAPSLLASAGLAAPASMQGRDLDFRLAQPPAPADPLLVAEINAPRPQLALRRGPWKTLIQLEAALGSSGPAAWYALEADPRETRPMAEPPAGAPALLDAIHSWRERAARVREQFGLAPQVVARDDMSAAQLAELRALGYVDVEE